MTGPYERPLYLAELAALSAEATRRCQYVDGAHELLEKAESGYAEARVQANRAIAKLEQFIADELPV